MNVLKEKIRKLHKVSKYRFFLINYYTSFNNNNGGLI
jgi:hypothetical protein